MDFNSYATMHANKAMKDDWFKMGGCIYRILHVTTNAFGGIVIQATRLNASSSNQVTFIVPPETPMKIYNQ